MVNAIDVAREMVEVGLVERAPGRRAGPVASHRRCLPRPHVEQGPLGRDEIFEIVRDRLADILEIEPSTISEGQSFVDDLDADSLALIELVEALEEELSDRTVGFRIDDEDLADLKTRPRRRRLRARAHAGGRLTLELARRAASGTSSTTRACSRGRWPTARGAPSTRARSATSGSSSSATPCSAGSSPTSPTAASATCPRARSPACARASSTPSPSPTSPCDLELGAFLLLGRGEDAAGGREKPSILSDALEAVFGAVYVDGGPSDAYDLIERLIGPRLAETAAHLDRLDHKSRLQELRRRATAPAPPEYLTRSEGPDHAKRFFATVAGRRRGGRRGHRPLEEGRRAGGRAAACAASTPARSPLTDMLGLGSPTSGSPHLRARRCRSAAALARPDCRA